MSEYRFGRCVRVAAPVELVRQFFIDGEAWFRLNPEWEVLTIGDDSLKVRYERSEVEAEYCRPASADFSGSGNGYALAGEPPRTIRLNWIAEDLQHSRIDWAEDFPETIEDARRAELNLWVDAAAGYLAIAARRDRRGRLLRWFLDRIWLKMSPTGRRVGLLIIGMEALALLLFIAILIGDRLFG